MSHEEYQPIDEDQPQEEYRRIEAPQKKKKKGDNSKQVVKYFLYCMVLLVFAIVAVNVFRPNKAKRKGMVVGFPPVTLTAEQKKEVASIAKEIATHLTDGHGEDCQALTDWKVIIARVGSEVKESVGDNNEIRDKINKDWASGSEGLFRNILLDVARDAQKLDVDALGFSERDGYTTVRLRVAAKSHPYLVEYHEVLLYPVKQEDGSTKMKLIDVFDAQSAIWATDRLRWAAIQEAGMKEEERGMWVRTFGDVVIPHLPDMKALVSQDVLRNGTAAMNTIKAFPDALRNHPDIWALELTACRNTLDSKRSTETELDTAKARLQALLAAPPKEARNQPEVGTLLAEQFLLAGDQAKAEELLQKAFEKQKDGYLQFLISKVRLEKGDVPGAESAFQKAKSAAPHLKGLFDHGKAIEAKKQP
jgi:hypothetical protein